MTALRALDSDVIHVRRTVAARPVPEPISLDAARRRCHAREVNARIATARRMAVVRQQLVADRWRMP